LSNYFYKFGEVIYYENSEIEKKFYTLSYIIICTIASLSYGLNVYADYHFIYKGIKQCFPFEEPSHFALFMAPILIAISSKFKSNICYVYTIILAICALYFKSLIFLVFLFVSLILNIKDKMNIGKKYSF
jgi:hypothetical protein